MILAIDPGTNAGWAFFDDGQAGSPLMACGLGLTTFREALPRFLAALTSATIERPRIYPGGRTKNPNDIVTLAILAGEWSGRLQATGVSVSWVEPRTWKGSLDKAVCVRRVMARLMPGECEVFDSAVKSQKVPKGKWNNVQDAIGVGLWVSGRLRPGL